MASAVLATFAAFVLVRYRRFPGRTLFSGMVNAPLVMPEVVIGLSLLLLMVGVQNAFGWPQRGMLTIVLGHTLLGMAYGMVVIQSRLLEMNRGHRRGRHGPGRPAVSGVLSDHHAQYLAGHFGRLPAGVHAVVRRRGDLPNFCPAPVSTPCRR